MQIVIIGNGISGITAARHIRKQSDHDILVISSETDHFFSRTALMYIYMGHMRYKDTKPYEDWFWEKNRIDLLNDYISSIDTDNKQLVRSNGERVNYDKLIIASGSKSNKFGWPGQDLRGVQGLYSYQDLQQLEQNTSPKIDHAVIVGGGLIGIELGEMLHSRNIHTTFIVREKSYWDNVLPHGESNLISRHIREHGFDLLLETELKEIIGNENGWVEKVITNKSEEIPCQLVGLTAGVSPNVEFVKSSSIEVQRGVMINNSFETSVKDVYAVGDCAQFREPVPGRRPIEQVWYTGKMHGETVANAICNPNKTISYDPGPWFNSAKFLDIEYQTYGMVMPQLKENEQSLYWEHEEGRHCVNIVYDKSSKEFIGINLFGIRCRHDAFDHWLRKKASIEEVLEHLLIADFDPEFFNNWYKQILTKYNAENNTSLKIKAKGFKGFLQKIYN